MRRNLSNNYPLTSFSNNMFNSWFRDVDRMFDDFFSSFGGTSGDNTSPTREGAYFTPACDIEEKDDHYLLNVDLPGLKKEDVKIEMNNQQLIITGQRKDERKVEERSGLYSERFHGTFRRVLSFPQGLDADKIEAQFENGVLSLYLPKTEGAKPKQIPIKSEKGFFKKLLGEKEENKQISA